MPRKLTLRQKIEQRIARRRVTTSFLHANLRNSAARIKCCACSALWYTTVVSCASATGSMAVRRAPA